MSIEAENGLTKDVNQVECRSCLQIIQVDDGLLDIFQAWESAWEGMERTIAEDLAKLASIEISVQDQHSKHICNSCCEKLQLACSFASIVRENDRILRLRYPPNEDEVIEKVWPQPIQIDKTIGNFDQTLDMEIKQEVLSDEEYNTCHVEDEYRDSDFINNLDIKVEPEEIVEPNTIQVTINGTISLNEFSTGESSIQITNGENQHDERYLETKVKEEPVSEPDEAESMPNDLPLECMLCTRSFNSVSGLKAHVIAQHSYKTVKRKAGQDSPATARNDKHVCVTCRRSFSTSTDLMVHETCHNKDVCYGCNAKFDSFSALTKHRKRCKAISSAELKRPKTLDDVKSHDMDEEIPAATAKNRAKRNDRHIANVNKGIVEERVLRNSKSKRQLRGPLLRKRNMRYSMDQELSIDKKARYKAGNRPSQKNT